MNAICVYEADGYIRIASQIHVEQGKAALDKARLIVAEHISVDMTDFEKKNTARLHYKKYRYDLKTIIRIHLR